MTCEHVSTTPSDARPSYRTGRSTSCSRSTSYTVFSSCTSSSLSMSSLSSPLLDEREHLEHREVHRDQDDPDHDSDADHHQRLDDRGERLDRRVDLVLVEVRDLRQHV